MRGVLGVFSSWPSCQVCACIVFWLYRALCYLKCDVLVSPHFNVPIPNVFLKQVYLVLCSCVCVKQCTFSVCMLKHFHTAIAPINIFFDMAKCIIGMLGFHYHIEFFFICNHTLIAAFTFIVRLIP